MAHGNTTLNLSNDLDPLHQGQIPILPMLLLLCTTVIVAMAWKSKPYMHFLKSKSDYIPLKVILSRPASPIRVPYAQREKIEFVQPADDDPFNEAAASSICSQSMVINAVEFRKLQEYLPVRLASKTWSLAYSTAIHGRSLAKFYRQNKRLSCDRSVIMLIRDTLGAVFGAFCPTPWICSPTHIGNGIFCFLCIYVPNSILKGETFVFRLRPEMNKFCWTRENAFFVIGQKKYLAVGGGSKFALWLDDSFERGSSSTSETFYNPVLSTLSSFDCSVMELWAI